jgi:hypothetical protein
MDRREIIQNMTILWISSILGASKAGLSKIYPQTLKKQFIKYPSLHALHEESLVTTFN